MTMRKTIPELTPDEATFVRRLNDGYAPSPMGALEQAAFDRRLDARLSRARRGTYPLLAVAAATAAALLIWVAVPWTHGPGPVPATPTTVAAAPPASGWDALAESYRWATGDEDADFATILPDDYQILAADYLVR